ncbi:5-methyltetrahydropteroyltriglutamate--homocysteine S-methyltransferase [Periweissella ghanensis]|uniref:5-methyltetrahydropteroyltriglutamate--homocysteine methyltransferase n=1 Tax=Periweissella ghanensis TaxID=467997 RepID=A0ABN8BJ38_9LACO|nr:5-methyltetrahydropteroyltriglutamate--homocysteine S-methyltransferase [Periweissella ghanensis]MCM0600846.1 5-methyltetrahydropteroyltriglutamate--homocysteine S-methyltransferase [Periweissella ghanensis]CAH0417737.1 5-methyltetrahydropteroyltriglutamate--homocysteine methyltransferase [Periweissella ghanensis]
MTTTVVGFPRIGEHRELKRITEKYWKNNATQTELLEAATAIKEKHWDIQAQAGIDFVSAGDFSFFDNVLDTAYLLNIIPNRYRELDLDDLDQYFALARGYQEGEKSVKALPMKKWFNTNYHYIVPEINDTTQIKVTGNRLFDDVALATSKHANVKASIVGPFTLLKLARYIGTKQAADFAVDTIAAYREIFAKLNETSIAWLQIDEPALVFDLTDEDKAFFQDIYTQLLAQEHGFKVNIQTYFGDVRDIYSTLVALPVEGLGLDLLEGKYNRALIKELGFPNDKILFAGVVNGKNIWRNEYRKTVELIKSLPVENYILSTSCSLLHVPFTTANEPNLNPDLLQHLAFAVQKLTELKELDAILAGNGDTALEANEELFASVNHPFDANVHARIDQLTEADYHRQPSREERAKIQKAEFNLPELPTTTIGSFPQTADVRSNRAKFRKGEITRAEYDAFNREKIADIVKFQEEIGLDVLVHGEFERNDMVEYFGEHLAGFEFTKNAWVQSYGSRAVKPPIIWGDVSRKEAITVETSAYAQSLTDKWMKGMLTGPVTIFNWSFPREDITPEESVTQIALAIQDEVLDLEAHGIKIIQIDEAALREKLPLRKSDWFKEYLDWAVPAFRLVHSKVEPTTQIHTHMCYSEFNDIVKAIDDLDADVISFEASRSDLSLIEDLKANNFETEVGPGIYDIHSPRIPSKDELVDIINKILAKLPTEKVWINPDCGLKTRGDKEATESLENLVAATFEVRGKLNGIN